MPPARWPGPWQGWVGIGQAQAAHPGRHKQARSTGSQTGIVLLISVIPGVIALLAAFVMRYYSLDNQQLAKIQFDLQQRKAAAAPL